MQVLAIVFMFLSLYLQPNNQMLLYKYIMIAVALLKLQCCLISMLQMRKQKVYVTYHVFSVFYCCCNSCHISNYNFVEKTYDNSVFINHVIYDVILCILFETSNSRYCVTVLISKNFDKMQRMLSTEIISILTINKFVSS